MHCDPKVLVQQRADAGMLVGGAVVAVFAVVAQPHPGLGLGDQLEVGQELGGWCDRM